MPAFFGVDKMWQDLFAAVALMLVLEGVLPFLTPAGMRKVYRQMAEADDRTLRLTGLMSMIGGVVLLYWVR